MTASPSTPSVREPRPDAQASRPVRRRAVGNGDGPSAAGPLPLDERAAATVAVAGGGQLARMMAPAAHRLGLELLVLDPDAECAAAEVADALLVGDYADAAALAGLAGRARVVTFEIEQTDVAGLRALLASGCPVAPSPDVLEVVQDKLGQKRFLAAHGLPVSEGEAFDPHTPPALPFVWKARRGGYDGRGVAVVRSAADLAALPAVPGLCETQVDIERELAIMVARSAAGHVVLYPLTEILMDPERHVLDTVVAPAAVAPRVEQTCRALARRIVEALDYVGVLAVEFFVDRVGDVLVNEISPRPHNSGHYTIEACITSQFEQHLRAVAGLDLGPADMHGAAATFNVLAGRNAAGEAVAPRYDALAGRSGVHVHDYGKAANRPGRKLGHVTVLADDPRRALERAAECRALLEAGT